MDDTRNDTSPAPWPDAGDTSVIQLTIVDACHMHSGCVVIANAPGPPSGPIIAGEPTDTRHFTGLGFALIVETVSQLENMAATRHTATAAAPL